MFEVGKKYINTNENAGKTFTRHVKIENERKPLFGILRRKPSVEILTKSIYIPKEITILSKTGNICYLAVDDKGEQLTVDDDDSEMYVECCGREAGE